MEVRVLQSNSWPVQQVSVCVLCVCVCVCVLIDKTLNGISLPFRVCVSVCVCCRRVGYCQVKFSSNLLRYRHTHTHAIPGFLIAS